MDWNALLVTLLFCVGIASLIGAIFTVAEAAATSEVYGYNKHARKSTVAAVACTLVFVLCASTIVGMS